MNQTLLSAAAAGLLVVLSALVLLKESRQGRLLLAFGLLLLALVELFDSLALQGADQFMYYKRLALLCSSLFPFIFLLYGLLFPRRGALESRTLAVAPLLVVSTLACVAVLALPMQNFYSDFDVEQGRLLVLAPIGYWFNLGLMIFCIGALVNLESVFAGTRGADRWRIKHEFLGVGTILAVMIFYFSQGLLYRAVNMSLVPVRSGVMIVAVLLIGYSRLFRGRSASIVISRQALYRSFTLVAVGLYLLLLGVIGVGMRQFHVPIDQGVVVFVAILSGIGFLVLLLSEGIRQRARIFLATHFYAQKHDYREQWLGLSNTLAGCRDLDGVQAAIVDKYQRLLALRFAALYTKPGADPVFSLAIARDQGGMPARFTPSAALLGYFTETERVLNPLDGEYTPTPEEELFVREAGVWLMVPLLAEDRLEGLVVLGGQIVPEKLTYEDFALMKIVGRQAVLSLKNFQLSDQLAEARELAAVAKVSSFVIHDLKNLAYTFSLMMENADANIGEPEFQRDLVKSIRATVGKMNGLIGKLKAFPHKTELKLEDCDLAELAREPLKEVSSLKPALRFESLLEPADVQVDADEIRKVVLNLLLNACDAVRDDGLITLRTGLRDGEAFLSVREDGTGMSADFIEHHLFRPFRTTKEKGLGIGLYQCRQIVEAHGGRIEVESQPGEGSVFTILLPVRQPSVD